MQRKRPVEILTPEDVERLITTASRRAPAGIRLRALIALFYYSGLRLAEALALHPRDVDLEGGCVTVRRGKGGGQRQAGLNAAAHEHLSRWMERRRRLGIGDDAPVFCTFSRVDGARQVGPMAARYVQAALRRLARRAGVGKRVHPHGFRHSHAVHLLRRGVALPVIQRQLGHVNLATTDHYFRALGVGEHVERVRDLEW